MLLLTQFRRAVWKRSCVTPRGVKGTPNLCLNQPAYCTHQCGKPIRVCSKQVLSQMPVEIRLKT